MSRDNFTQEYPGPAPCALTAHLLLHTEYAGMWKPSPLSTGG
ncbi:hypothetical protein HMPREF1545_02684 [Oscillibacter sp. KLE 1728]|nr:hypothetical protein HMPREF1545_02684 [Oscillibacter sp. KLE 1728]